jgi:CheY-like chemotaxis protein
MKTVRLVLVDDNEDNLEILTVILSEKYDVVSYRCAEEALTALETDKPDLVMLDIGMSPVDGVQCLKAIRAIPGYGSIPAIALTAYARDVDRKSFLATGFQAVITKPILDHRELFETITRLLRSEAAPGSRRSGGDPGSDQAGPSRRALDGAHLDGSYRMTA